MVSIPVGVKDFVLSTNLEGRWKLPNNVYISSQTIAYTMLSYEYFGLYEFYVSNWDENEVIGIKINVVPGGKFHNYVLLFQTYSLLFYIRNSKSNLRLRFLTYFSNFRLKVLYWFLILFVPKYSFLGQYLVNYLLNLVRTVFVLIEFDLLINIQSRVYTNYSNLRLIPEWFYYQTRSRHFSY